MPNLKNRSFKLIDFNVNDIEYEEKKQHNKSESNSSEECSSSGSDDSTFKEKIDIKLFTIQMFGINEIGKTCSITIRDFKPYFYIKIPNNFDNRKIKKLENVFQKQLGPYYKNSLVGFHKQKKNKLYGFDANENHSFICLQFNNVPAMNKLKNMFYSYVNKKRVLSENGLEFENSSLYLYEGNIPPVLRFFHITNISPSGWVEIPLSKATTITKINKQTTCTYEYEISYKDIIPLNDKEIIVPYKICSFDIEASSSHGDFPLPVKTYKKLAQNIVDILISWKKEDRFDDFTKYEFKKMILSAFEYDTYENIDIIFVKEDKTKEELENLIDALNFNSVKDMIQLSKDEKKDIEDLYEKQWEKNNAEEENDEENPSNYKKSIAFKKIQENTNIFTILQQINDENKKIDRDYYIQILNKCFNAIFPEVKGDEITFIGSTFINYGEDKPYLNHCLALGTCDKVENSEIQCCETEKDVMLEWTKLINKEDPDIIIGYNIFGFDYDFMYRRAIENNIVSKFLLLSRNKKELCLSKKFDFNSKKTIQGLEQTSIVIASGQHDLKFIKMNGRLQVDLYNYFRRDYNLNSYKLDHVAGYFIGDNVKNIEHNNNKTIIYTKNISGLEIGNYINFEEISHSSDYYKDGKKFCVEDIDKINKTFTINNIEQPDMSKQVKWGLAKDDVSPQDIFRMTNEGPKERAKIAKYCIQDCNLVHHLLKKIDVITGYVEMAKICSVPINFLVMRGQGIKLTSYIAKKCREKNVLMPTIEKPEYNDPKDGEQWSGYDGAIVLDPKCNLYLDKPVACVDYSSLYPSSMISENLSHDSKVWTKEYDLNNNLIENSEWGEKDEQGNFKYDNLENYQYVDIEYETYKWEANERGKLEKKVSGKKVCRFAQFPDNKKGIMPSILEELLAARKATRKKIKSEPDPFMQNILDKRQLSYKITANSLYGQCGAKTSTFFEKDVAAATTATGRKLLIYAKEVIENCYGDHIVDTKYGKMRTRAEYIYGDTDSVFFTFNFETLEGEKITGKKALEMTIDLAQEAGSLATLPLKKPHDLEYEKTFMPFCLLSKKRYVGMLYETDFNKGDRKSMGIVLKRRDNAPIVKDIYGGIIDILMKEQDIEKAVEFLQNSLQDLINEKVPIEKLIISKSLRSTYKNPDQIAHKVLADRMGKRDPGNKPSCGDRIPFAYIKTDNPKALQGDKIEHPTFIEENNLKLDYEFYITNQIMKPVQQVFELVLEDINGFKNRKNTLYAQINCLKRQFEDDEEKLNKKIMDLRNKEVKELLFDPYLTPPVKKTRASKKTSPKEETNDEKPVAKKRGRPRKLKIVEELDPVVSGDSEYFQK
jgi:DNA polymerase elongation subunit (family B)